MCGYYNHPDKECSCPPGSVQKYLTKISGPLLDRIDLHMEVMPVPFTELKLKEVCVLSTACQNLLRTAMDRLNLSARAYDRILKVSRTIADLAEAIQYRSLDREGWGG